MSTQAQEAVLFQGAYKMTVVDVVPAILPRTFSHLEEDLSCMQNVASFIQVDIVDGIFAPGKTWPYIGGDEFEKIRLQERGLPFWEDFDFQFDLMVAHPTQEIMRFVEVGASSVVVHAANKEAVEALRLARQVDVLLGLALLPDASVETLLPFAGLYDFVQVMGIAQVGAQGRPFDERTIALVEALRVAYPDLRIQVDGGVSLANCRPLATAGANCLVVGSAIFGSSNPASMYKVLYDKTNA